MLAVSGLDDVGVIDPGDNEIYDPRTKKWTDGPKRYFPTYPALFLTKGGKLFYPASNAGYGPAEKGREPGLWDLETNTFTKVPGLTDTDETETSASVLLPPAQDQRVMILGGGGVGESDKATGRTAVIDLKEENPSFKTGPQLPQGTRYLNSVLMPDDSVFTSNGSSDYRGRGASNILKAQFYDPKTNAFRAAASPKVGRNDHSEALSCPTAAWSPSAPTRSTTTSRTPSSATSSSAWRSSRRRRCTREARPVPCSARDPSSSRPTAVRRSAPSAPRRSPRPV
ncbi:hypothetical protein SALBM135S_07149 [Streptomyces alboniger]